ncbi:MAG: hypothetical protein ACI8RZ_000455 [Myxococcota bacterium]|jgi:hypothetical protein
MLTLPLLSLIATAADDGSCDAWLPAKIVASVENNALDEISGLVASRTHANILWGHNDAGNDALIYAIGVDGADNGEVFIYGAINEDWEDIAIGPCASTDDGCSCLYIGDIGDNDLTREGGVVYRLPEPDLVTGDGQGQGDAPEALPFRYPDGAHDAEALLVHPISGETFIITKNDPAGIYAFPSSPPAGGPEVELVLIATLDLTAFGVDSPFITGADFSPRGRRVAVRTDADVLLFDVSTTMADAFSDGPDSLPDPPEQDAEAVAFSVDGTVLYLMGESVAPELWEIRCVSMESDTADTADPLMDCEEEEESCGCRGSGAAMLLPLMLLWRRRRGSGRSGRLRVSGWGPLGE